MIKVIETKTQGSHIEFSSPELMWLGLSGQPYRGSLQIEMISNGKSFDLLSLKKYITSLRSQVVILEDIAQKILNDLDLLENNTLSVSVRTTPRGGISSKISAKKQ